MPSKRNLPFKQIQQEISGRDDVFAVCLCFLCSIAPHFRNLPAWIIVLVFMVTGYRSLQNMGHLRDIPKWLLVSMVIIGGLGVFADYWTIVGRDAGLAMLTVTASFKFLESRTHRDMLILVFLSYFLVAVNFLFSQSMLIALLMFINLIIITATLVTLNQRDASVTLQERIKTSSRLIALSVPVMIILFLLVPRIPGPLWGLTGEQRGGITGLSDSMSPGAISSLIRNNEVAFRAEFNGAVPSQARLYWRGPIMSRFNGYRWSQIKREASAEMRITAMGEPIEYTVTLEPNGKPWVLALDMPTHLIDDSYLTKDFQLTRQDDINDLLRYTTSSYIDYRIGLDEDPDYLRLTRDFPMDSNPRTIALGQELARQHESSEAIVNHVLEMFNQQTFTYTLRPPVLSGDTVDQFLFESRRGFCEHFAGAFALLMRAAGIPARIVAGYQGGEYNSVGNYLIVRQSDAHAWTEVWIKERGWVRIDPTAAVSPDRIEQSLDDALSEEASTFRIHKRNPIFGELLYNWDNLQHSWNDWVLDYNGQRQMNFLRQLDLGIDSWGDMIIALVLLLALMSLMLWFIVWYRERPPRPEVYEILLNRMQHKLAKKGWNRSPAEDTRAFLRRITVDGAQHNQIARVIELYNRIKYGPIGVTPDSVRELRQRVDAIDSGTSD